VCAQCGAAKQPNVVACDRENRGVQACNMHPCKTCHSGRAAMQACNVHRTTRTGRPPRLPCAFAWPSSHGYGT
jgi:hypothetical protein